jgi:uncharacterized protein YybS (DUF2232 family)
MKRTFGLFYMITAYACTIMCMASVTYYVIFANKFANAFIMALAGFAVFMIAETFKNERRKGKL